MTAGIYNTLLVTVNDCQNDGGFFCGTASSGYVGLTGTAPINVAPTYVQYFNPQTFITAQQGLDPVADGARYGRERAAKRRFVAAFEFNNSFASGGQITVECRQLARQRLAYWPTAIRRSR